MPQTNRLNLPSSSIRKQMNGKEVWNGCRSATTADFFTVGYSGRKTEEVMIALVNNGVRTLVDVRQNPVSMYRPELSKSNLARLLIRHGISYAHLPQLGVPRDIRAMAVYTGTREVIWDWYDKNVIGSFFGLGSNLHFFLNCVEHPVALMCTELDPQECHRHRISLALERMGMNGFDL